MKRKAKKSQVLGLIQNVLVYSLGLVVFLGFVFITVWGQDGLIDLMRLSGQKDRIVTKNNQLLHENLMLLNQIESLNQERVLEQTIRSELGLIKPNELVFVIDPS